jgi:hypothetical protein
MPRPVSSAGSASASGRSASVPRPVLRSPLRTATMSLGLSPSLAADVGGPGAARPVVAKVTSQQLRQMQVSEFCESLRTQTNKHKHPFQERHASRPEACPAASWSATRPSTAPGQSFASAQRTGAASPPASASHISSHSDKPLGELNLVDPEASAFRGDAPAGEITARIVRDPQTRSFWLDGELASLSICTWFYAIMGSLGGQGCGGAP